jgi:hypothetical protein
MNKFTIICTHSSGAFSCFTSENANLDLVKEVFKILYGDLQSIIFEGHIEPINRCDIRPLRNEVINHLIFQRSVADECVYNDYKEKIDKNISKLREYMKATET